MTRNKVYCDNSEQFFTCIQEFTERGLTFEAHVDSKTIILTGGY